MPSLDRAVARAKNPLVSYVGNCVRIPAGGNAPSSAGAPFFTFGCLALSGCAVRGANLRILSETDRRRHVAAEVYAEVPDIAGNLTFDAHTVILMRENGIKVIYTRDTDFNRFPFLDTIDPVTRHRRTRA